MFDEKSNKKKDFLIANVNISGHYFDNNTC